ERREEQHEEQALEATGVLGDEIRDRVADHQTERARDRDEHEGVRERVPVDRTGPEDRRDEVTERPEVPTEGTVHRRGREEDRVDVSERDRQDHVEGDDEQQEEPDYGRGRERGPEPRGEPGPSGAGVRLLRHDSPGPGQTPPVTSW